MTSSTRHLHERPCLLLDFDGPICSVFSGVSSRTAVEQLVTLLESDIPAEVTADDDPFDVLAFAALLGPTIADAIERQLATIELDAIASARPTPHAHNVIRTAARHGRIAIVSNNSHAAISAYLDAHGLTEHVTGVYARTDADPSHLKPHPYLLHAAIRGLGTTPDQCTFVGDSVTDILAGEAAAVPVIAFANKPGKSEKLAAHVPAAIINSMNELFSASTSPPADHHPGNIIG
ncbi:HAD family hydrolase [Nocardia macrotermitis]|uniref:Phosphoglycolate phosphatase n=1 Tax=Nocardia macrotermitis TaxID=2585198 RepID=A0A7K0CZ44_9NOCA|nr:HAD family hydrolase [Nocardia macrotermitis]MQY18710.1 Phosphoglycolate phosphatase [Nocardia macrotermitis]